MYLIGRSQSVDLVDLDTSTILHTFHTEPMQPRTLKQISITRPQQPGLASLTLAYTSTATGDLVIHTYLPSIPETDTPLLYPPTPIEPGAPTNPWTQPNETTKHIPNPGVWDALPTGSILGVRSRCRQPAPSPCPSGLPTQFLLGGLRRRRYDPPQDTTTVSSTSRSSSSGSSSSGSSGSGRQDQGWEAWVLDLRPDAKSEFETLRIDGGGGGLDGEGEGLMIAEVGPMVRLGTGSVAVGFGDVVKVVSVGHEFFDDAGLGAAVGLEVVGSRRKKGSGAGARCGGAGGKG